MTGTTPGVPGIVLPPGHGNLMLPTPPPHPPPMLGGVNSASSTPLGNSLYHSSLLGQPPAPPPQPPFVPHGMSYAHSPSQLQVSGGQLNPGYPSISPLPGQIYGANSLGIPPRPPPLPPPPMPPSSSTHGLPNNYHATTGWR